MRIKLIILFIALLLLFGCATACTKNKEVVKEIDANQSKLPPNEVEINFIDEVKDIQENGK